jgi:SHS2 domain-containing protein
VLVEDPETVAESRTLEVDLVGDDREFLFFDWLRTLLYHFDAEHLLFRRFEVQVRPDGLHGTAYGEPLDRSRHELGHEVKAITYHGLRVEQTADGWLAEVIVDI